MKRFVYGNIILLFILAACHKRSVPIITSRTSQPIFTAPDTLHIVPDIEGGLVVFTNRCSRCHGLPVTDQYTVKRWEIIMISMAPRARLDKNQTLNVTAYVKAHAKAG
jgi:hypothetical protein